MTLHHKEKQVAIEQINAILNKYQKTKVTVQQYCKLASKVLNLHPDKLHESYLQFLQSPNRNEKGNYKMVAGFLCSPNIKYIQDDKDRRNEERMLQAGQKIINTISYAWDCYFRLIKDHKQPNAKQEQKKETKEPYYQDDYLVKAKKSLMDMLNEMQRNKYHWQNYTKQNLASRQAEEKQISEQQTLMRLLLNILESQSSTIKQESNIPVQLQDEGIIRIEQKLTENKVSESEEENKQNKVDLTKVINLSSYFQKRLQFLQSKIEIIDPITKIQQQRKFNSNFFRYKMQADNK